MFSFVFFYSESGLGSAKTIARINRRNAGKVCFNKFQRSSTALHALALMRCLLYEMVYEKASASWRACRILGMKMIFTRVHTCMTHLFHSSHTQLRNIFSPNENQHPNPYRKPNCDVYPKTFPPEQRGLSGICRAPSRISDQILFLPFTKAITQLHNLF